METLRQKYNGFSGCFLVVDCPSRDHTSCVETSSSAAIQLCWHLLTCSSKNIHLVTSGGTTWSAGCWAPLGSSASSWRTNTTRSMSSLRITSQHGCFGGTTPWPMKRTWRSLPRLISCLGLGGSPSSIFLKRMCKAPFLAVSPGRCPGPLAASSHRAKSILESRRSGRIMRSLPERPTRQPLFHPKSPCCNQRHSFLFIFRELTGETKWTKFYAKDWSSEVLPFGFFSSFIPRNIYFPVALHSGRTRPQAGVLQRQKRTR